ncbi:hypothetical protein K2X33_06315 [bacterium]|nr:hypothetical protein [bacterium]
MIPNEKFKFEVKPEGGSTRITLKGVIDEDTDFEALKKTGAPALVVNFKGVTSINSCGIRTWVNFVKELQSTPIQYEECPPLVVRQMNMVPSFVGHAKVSSAFVPYVCDNCETEKLVLVPAKDFGNGNPNIPETLKCESCGEGEMEIDGNPKQYFAFAK